MKLLLLQAPFFWGSLLWLCFLLAGEGTKGPNRFGDATREAP
jgi:predicted small lipoprotein YifL